MWKTETLWNRQRFYFTCLVFWNSVVLICFDFCREQTYPYISNTYQIYQTFFVSCLTFSVSRQCDLHFLLRGPICAFEDRGLPAENVQFRWAFEQLLGDFFLDLGGDWNTENHHFLWETINHYITTAWCFGTMDFLMTSHHIGNFIIPTDVQFFQRGRSTTNQFWLGMDMRNPSDVEVNSREPRCHYCHDP